MPSGHIIIRLLGLVPLLAMLVACSGAPSAMLTPTANRSPTETRVAELATLTAPTVTVSAELPVVKDVRTATSMVTSTATTLPNATKTRIVSPTPTLEAQVTAFDILLPADAPNPLYAGFEVAQTERYSLRLVGSETVPQNVAPGPPMNSCGSRYFVLRFRTVGDRPVMVYVGTSTNINPLPGSNEPQPRQIGTINAGVLVLNGCMAGLFMATTHGLIVDIVAEQITYEAAPIAPGTTVPKPAPIPTAIPTLSPVPLPATLALTPAPVNGAANYALEYAAKNLDCRLTNSTGEFFIQVRGAAAPRFCREWLARYPTYRFFGEAHLLNTLWRDSGAKTAIDVYTTRRTADADSRWVVQEAQRIWNLP